MKLIPRPPRRSMVRLHSAGSSGGPQIPFPVRRIAPKPSRWTSRSPPILKDPLCTAFAWLIVSPRHQGVVGDRPIDAAAVVATRLYQRQAPAHQPAPPGDEQPPPRQPRPAPPPPPPPPPT